MKGYFTDINNLEASLLKRCISIILVFITLLCSCSSYSIVEQGKNYVITQSNKSHQYHYKILDNNGKTIEEEDISTYPKIQAVSDSIIEVQTGSGNVVYRQYFNINDRKKSELFQNPIIMDYGKIVYASTRDGKLILIVQDLFNRSEFYKEFELDFSPVAIPEDAIVNVQFIEDGTKLRVKYLSGDDYYQKIEDLNLY